MLQRTTGACVSASTRRTLDVAYHPQTVFACLKTSVEVTLFEDIVGFYPQDALPLGQILCNYANYSPVTVREISPTRLGPVFGVSIRSPLPRRRDNGIGTGRRMTVGIIHRDELRAGPGKAGRVRDWVVAG